MVPMPFHRHQHQSGSLNDDGPARVYDVCPCGAVKRRSEPYEGWHVCHLCRDLHFQTPDQRKAWEQRTQRGALAYRPNLG